MKYPDLTQIYITRIRVIWYVLTGQDGCWIKSGGQKILNEEKELRLANFEKMMAAVEKSYDDTVAQMEKLKAAGKVKSATYGQLMGNKLMYQNMLTLYKLYGLLEE